ncbi:netrin receptor UNC5C-like isoform X2 [Artemia franciscana]|uniref:netrin receptor UNC5C-like isoform X2 n=1 Tax=Artemia franciscana TaxID=6661 RepID=UPI0032DB47DE
MEVLLVISFFSALLVPGTFAGLLDGEDALLLDPLMSSGTGKPDNRLPVFLEEPEDSFVVKNKPAILNCKAANALQVYFVCNGETVKERQQSLHDYVDPMSGVRQIEVTLNVTRNDVEEFFGEYSCECVAWSSFGERRSRKAKIIVAFIKKYFIENPYSTSVELEKQVQLRCLPPEGVPLPEVSWRKNGSPIDPATVMNYIISNEGHLLIVQATLADVGNYTCVADSLAGQRISDVATLTVVVNGGWSSWSMWSDCTPLQGTCGIGTKKKGRTCTNPAPLNGGKPCPGLGIVKLDCNIPCPAIDGKWSSWSGWSVCSSDCRQFKTRSCNNPAPSGEGRFCQGKDAMFTDCTGGKCRIGRELGRSEGSESGDEGVSRVDSDLPLYVGIGTGIILLVVLVFGLLLFRLAKNKIQHSPMVPEKPTGYVISGYYPSPSDKRSLHLQDSSQTIGLLSKTNLTVPYCEYTYSEPASSLTSHNRNVVLSPSSEHLYESPHVMAFPSGLGKEISQSPLPAPSPMSSINKPESDRSLSSTLSSSSSGGSSQSYDSEGRNSTYPEMPNVCTWATVTSAGAKIVLPEAGVFLTVPQGAVPHGKSEEIYVAIIVDDRDRPDLNERQTLLSPLIACGPSGLSLKKPVVVSFQHCALLTGENSWNLTVLSSPRGANEKPQWEPVLTLGDETINTSIYVQVEASECHILTDELNYFTLIGESSPKRTAAKQLRLAIYAPLTSDNYLKVYVTNDTVAALRRLNQLESRTGHKLLDSKTVEFCDTSANLILKIEDIEGTDWRLRNQAEEQDVEFSRLWCLRHPISWIVDFERASNLATTVSCTISAKQIGSAKTQCRINIGECRKMIGMSSPPCRYSPQESIATTTTNGTSTALHSFPLQMHFRIPLNIKRQLCLCLDQPNVRGTDWRLLAQSLRVDRYINYFATKPSPTEHILDLWEAKDREPNSLANLLNILRLMQRDDAVKILEKAVGAWC